MSALCSTLTGLVQEGRRNVAALLKEVQNDPASNPRGKLVRPLAHSRGRNPEGCGCFGDRVPKQTDGECFVHKDRLNHSSMENTTTVQRLYVASATWEGGS